MEESNNWHKLLVRNREKKRPHGRTENGRIMLKIDLKEKI
jgi:hypothetical protein